MHYLVDGYNLLYAMGLIRGQAGPTGLQKARLRLLGLLHGTYKDDSPTVTVVFDAAGAPPGADEEQDYQGIRVRFAVHNEQADDLIESLIRHDSAPRHLTVVSDDHRLQQAARRRQCVVLGCAGYLDFLERQRRRRPRPSGPGKPEHLTEHEAQCWLHEFSDLENDPELRQLFDPHGSSDK
jgi:hypothetical protein